MFCDDSLRRVMANCERGRGAVTYHWVFCVDEELPGMRYEVDPPLMFEGDDEHVLHGTIRCCTT